MIVFDKSIIMLQEEHHHARHALLETQVLRGLSLVSNQCNKYHFSPLRFSQLTIFSRGEQRAESREGDRGGERGREKQKKGKRKKERRYHSNWMQR